MSKTVTRNLEIAILGGGFAGVYCGKSLFKHLGRGSAKVGLVSDENYMVFQPMLPEVASASISPRHVVNPIRHLCRHLQVYKANVDRIDVAAKSLTLSPGPFSPPIEVRFQHLVVALGAEVDLTRVPGMTEHAFLMRNVGDAMKLRAAVLSRFEEANLVTDAERRRRLLTFVVVGGGYSGVETAGQILDLFQGINRFYLNIGPADFRVVLVHSRDHLLPTLSRKLGDYAGRKLRERGLEIVLGTRVKSLTAEKVYLADGTVIPANTVVSTVGNAPHPLVTKLAADLGVETDKGRLKTGADMRVTGSDWIWSAGDCASVPMEGGETCPATAQFAMRQGAHLGANIASAFRGSGTKPFRFKGLGELAAIGHRTAVAEILGLKFSGFFAWWMWRTIYLSKLPGIDRKLRVVIDWTLDLFFPRDINLLSPRYTHTLREAYLQKDDVLFTAGEPAFSFYIVKSGRIRLTDPEGGLIKTVADGEFFGERALLSDRRWRFTAEAAEDTTLVALGSEEFKALMESSSTLRSMLRRTARQYRSPAEIDDLLGTLPSAVLGEPAERFMSADLVAVAPGDSIADTLRKLNRERHGFYPVVDPENGGLRGVLTRDAFYDHVQSGGLRKGATVADIELETLPVFPARTPVAECLQAMVRGGSYKILLTGEDGRLRGLLSIRDIMEEAAAG